MNPVRETVYPDRQSHLKSVSGVKSVAKARGQKKWKKTVKANRKTVVCGQRI